MILGSDFVITTEFRDGDGNLADPDSVSALIEAPDRTQSSPVPTSTETGIWVTTGPADQKGIWFYQITGTDSEGDVVDAGSFCVESGLVLV